MCLAGSQIVRLPHASCERGTAVQGRKQEDSQWVAMTPRFMPSKSNGDICRSACSHCRLVALAATLQPDAGTQQRQVMQSGLSLALRLGVPEQDFLQRLLDPQHGLTFYGESARELFTQHSFQWLDSDCDTCQRARAHCFDEAACKLAGAVWSGSQDPT